MDNLANVCPVELVVGANYVRCLVIAVIYMGLEETKRCGGSFKVILREGVGAAVAERLKPKKGTSFIRDLIILYIMERVVSI